MTLPKRRIVNAKGHKRQSKDQVARIFAQSQRTSLPIVGSNMIRLITPFLILATLLPSAISFTSTLTSGGCSGIEFSMLISPEEWNRGYYVRTDITGDIQGTSV